MAQHLLKFWPVSETGTSQIDLLREQLTKDDLIAEPVDERPHTYYSGKRLEMYLFQPTPGMEIQLLAQDHIEPDDGEPIVRQNVLAIYHADEFASDWTKMEAYLKEVTGRTYRGGQETVA